MGSYQYMVEVKTNCVNCNKEFKTIHPAFNPFCSIKCQKRYRQRQENGMVSKPNADSFFPYTSMNQNDYRIDNMRARIRHLEHQLRDHGIKPKRMPY